jgi:hypothetical protein
MKKIYLSVLAALLLSLFICTTFAENKNNPITLKKNNSITSDTVTKTFAVGGNGICKSNIEGIVTSNAGVLSASWDSVAKAITVTFVWTTIKKIQIGRILAQAGYDNAFVLAQDSVYNALPANCQYTRLSPPINASTN